MRCSRKGIPFTAVVCANDEMAAGAMAAAHERGSRSCRDELSIVGFDDAPISRYVYPKLTTVHYPIARHGPHGRALGAQERLPAGKPRRSAARVRAELRRSRLGVCAGLTLDRLRVTSPALSCGREPGSCRP